MNTYIWLFSTLLLYLHNRVNLNLTVSWSLKHTSKNFSVNVFAISLYEKCPNTEFFLVRISPHSDWIRIRKNYVFGHFSRSVYFSDHDAMRLTLWRFTLKYSFEFIFNIVRKRKGFHLFNKLKSKIYVYIETWDWPKTDPGYSRFIVFEDFCLFWK